MPYKQYSRKRRRFEAVDVGQIIGKQWRDSLERRIPPRTGSTRTEADTVRNIDAPKNKFQLQMLTSLAKPFPLSTGSRKSSM
ncbi:hypothetical protein pipiens_012353, partial [Culex pipiens pipiens]